MSFTPIQKSSATPVQMHRVPKGYSEYVEINGKWLFYNNATQRFYDPTEHKYYNIATKQWEVPKKIDTPSQQTQQPKKDQKTAYRGRVWQKMSDVSNKAMRKLAFSLCVLVAVALTIATACGAYATYALLLQQANPVGVIVGFLSVYFGIAAYKYSKIALEKLYQKS